MIIFVDKISHIVGFSFPEDSDISGTNWCSRYTPAMFNIYSGVTLPTGYVNNCFTYINGVWTVVVGKQADVDAATLRAASMWPSITSATATTGVLSDGVTQVGLSLVINAVYQATNYEIRYSKLSPTVYSYLTILEAGTVHLTGLSVDTQYKLSVRAFGLWGTTSWSGDVVATTSAAQAGGALDAAAAAALTAVWSNVSGAGKPADNATAGTTLNFNPQCNAADMWFGYANPTIATITDGISGATAIVGSSGEHISETNTFLCPINRRYKISALIRKTAGATGGVVYLGIRGADSNGVQSHVLGNYAAWSLPVDSLSTSFAYYSVEIAANTMPPETIRGSAHVICGYPAVTGGRVEFQNVRVEDITDAYEASLTSTWSGISNTPSNISTAATSGTELRNNQLTLYSSGESVGLYGTLGAPVNIGNIVESKVTVNYLNALQITAYDISADTLTGKTIQTGISGKRIAMYASNYSDQSLAGELHMWGPAAPGYSYTKIVAIGLRETGTGDYYIAEFGSNLLASNIRGVGITTTGGDGLTVNVTGSGNGIAVHTLSGTAIFALAQGNGIGLSAGSSNNYGLTTYGNARKSALRLSPISGFPTEPFTGDIFFNSDDGHFYGYTGSGWKQLDNA